MSRETPPLVPGFRLLKRLGAGSMGTVWLAHSQGRPDDLLALKILNERVQIREKEVRRFSREARVGGSLHHPNILPLLGEGTWEGGHFLAMEYCRGWSLSAILASERAPADEAAAAAPPPPRLDLEAKLALLAQIADALQYAHDNGVVHRDVKPGNILVREDLRPFLIDFGLARNFEVDPTLTSTNVILGTPGYMSPEQVRGDAGGVDHRTDIYSLGACLFECLTGRQPFTAPTFIELRGQILYHPPPSLRRLAPDTPAGVEAVVMRALEKKPVHRYQSAGELRDELRLLAKGLGPRTGRVGTALRHRLLWLQRNPRTAVACGALPVLLASSWFALGQWRDARAALSLSQVMLHFVEGDSEAGMRAVREHVERFQRDAQGAWIYLSQESVNGSLRRAIEPLDSRRIDESELTPAQVEFVSGLRAMVEMDYERAIERLRAALALDPGITVAQFQLFQCCYALQRDAEASQWLEQFLEHIATADQRHPRLEALRLELAGDYGSALERLRSCPEPSATLDRFIYSRQLGRLLLRRGKQRVASVAPGDAAREALASADLEEARTLFERALLDIPGDPATLLNLAVVYGMRGEAQRAAELSSQVIALAPKLGEAYVMYAIQSGGLAAPEPAIASIESAPESVREHPRVRMALAYLYEKRAELARVAAQSQPNPTRSQTVQQQIGALRHALELDPDRVESWSALATALWISPLLGVELGAAGSAEPAALESAQQGLRALERRTRQPDPLRPCRDDSVLPRVELDLQVARLWAAGAACDAQAAQATIEWVQRRFGDGQSIDGLPSSSMVNLIEGLIGPHCAAHAIGDRELAQDLIAAYGARFDADPEPAVRSEIARHRATLAAPK